MAQGPASAGFISIDDPADPPPALWPCEPPPIGRCLCFACWAPNDHASWVDARAAGWYAGTWSGPDEWAILCPDCYAADAGPVPR